MFAPWIAPYDPLAQSMLKHQPDPVARSTGWAPTSSAATCCPGMIYGSRNSLIFGLTVAGARGDRRHRARRRRPAISAARSTASSAALVDLLLAFPALLLGIMIAAALGGGFWNMVAVLTVAFVPGFARVARASTLSVKQEPFIEAAIAVGVRTPAIILRHILPNIAGSDRRADDAVGRDGRSGSRPR